MSNAHSVSGHIYFVCKLFVVSVEALLILGTLGHRRIQLRRRLDDR